jgi:hypothetical protein
LFSFYIVFVSLKGSKYSEVTPRGGGGGVEGVGGGEIVVVVVVV